MSYLDSDAIAHGLICTHPKKLLKFSELVLIQEALIIRYSFVDQLEQMLLKLL